MSKSKGNVIYADDLVKVFGVDAVRYLMLHEMPFAQDGTLTYEIMIDRINSDLANILGNLVNRTLTMVNKYFNGVLENPEVTGPFDSELIGLALATPIKVKDHMAHLRVQDAIDDIFELLRRSNKYIDETLPWNSAKDPADLPRLKTMIYNLCEAIRFAAVLLHSFIPATSKLILDQLNTQARDLDSLKTFHGIVDGTKVTATPTILFQRLDAKVVLNQFKPVLSQLDLKPEITIDEFDKLDLRIGTIITCENHPDSNKLLVSQIQIGAEIKQIVSGLRPTFEAQDLIGKQVVIVANLKAVKIRGVLSQGMLLVGEDKEKLELLHFHELKDGIVR